ncbi:RNA-guided pseudouridylation complex pseudouridine synthase subunit Cbf5 [Halobacteriota archaeon]
MNTKREMLVRAKDKTNPDHGCYPEKRDMKGHINKGLVNIDKPPGPTSHEAVAWIKGILHLSKAGHSGTLDPNVTGVLPVMLEDATKVVGALLTAGKEYICLMRLHRDVSAENLTRVFNQFVGPIYQLPPLKSAVKRRIRKRNIYYLEIKERDGKDILFRVGCEAGTYIRKLCHDIGKSLGTGAHMSELRRTRAGVFTEARLTTLHDLKDAYAFWEENSIESNLRKVILPMEHALEALPRIVIRDSAVDAICHGADLAVPGVLSAQKGICAKDWVAVFTLKGEAVCLGTAKMNSQQVLYAKKGVVVDTDRVLMEPNIYPRGW